MVSGASIEVELIGVANRSDDGTIRRHGRVIHGDWVEQGGDDLALMEGVYLDGLVIVGDENDGFMGRIVCGRARDRKGMNFD